MAAFVPVDFDSWLSVKLKALNTDENVFGFYIKGILEGDESQDEKIEALEGILAEISSNDGASQSDICKEILSKWEEYQVAAKEQKSDKVDVDIQIARIMGQQALSVVQPKKYTEEEKKLRQTILSQYAEVSEGDEEEDEEADAAGFDSGEEKGGGLTRNTNAEEVMKAERAKKEKLRQDSQKKKDKDKEDREKQKQLQQERKEREKKRTQKGEKKR
nr:EOG090X0H15 [Sida crystallina]